MQVTVPDSGDFNSSQQKILSVCSYVAGIVKLGNRG